MDRRRFLLGAGASGLCLAAQSGELRSSYGAGTASSRVRDENAKPGTTEWMLSHPRVQENKIRCPWIEGYCSRTSVKAGETIDIKVSTNPAARFTLDLYRLGYYGGKGGRLIERLGPFEGSPQSDPPLGEVRVQECNWPTAVSVTVPTDWVSGVYLGKLTEQREQTDSYVVFIVRDDRECDFLFQCSDTTWAAYNRWPDVWSLYDDGTPPHNWYTGPGVAVSFDRPYGRYRQIFDAPLSQGSGEFLLWEFPLAFWMEQHGYDVSYISNLDTHAHPERLLKTRAFLSVGHDEYWSLAMYDNVKRAIEAGVNAAFFCGNSVDGVLDIRAARAGPSTGSLSGSANSAGQIPRADRSFATPWKQHGPEAAALMVLKRRRRPTAAPIGPASATSTGCLPARG